MTDDPSPSIRFIFALYAGLIALFAALFAYDTNIALIALLVLFSGLFSGLTIGILGLSPENLKIEADLGSHLAKKILPVRKRGNLILSTLLVSNVIVNSVLSIFLSDVASGVIGGIIAIALITIFGEILPQSLAIKHGLKMGYVSLPFLYIVMALLYPITKPVAWALDRVVGKELPNIYSKRKLSKILEHVEDQGIIDEDEEQILLGGVSFSEKYVGDVMTPIDRVFLLPLTTILSEEKLHEIYASGHSRIPIYDEDIHDIVGLLYVKKLIAIHPRDNTPVEEVMSEDVPKVMASEHLDAVLNKFKLKRKHLFAVYDTNSDAAGIITLEDIMEEILQDEIVDETDFGERAKKK
jgi:metal transporter CNNM